ncbi:hypothetical protein [Leucobacter soli]|uniref:hypothetical protein n=1 Tax=Leucobacter soli TaxID=2812850 RepID=UPI0036233288
MGPTARPSALASILSALAALALVLGAVGCADGPGGDASAATDALTSEDQRAIAELTEIAPATRASKPRSPTWSSPSSAGSPPRTWSKSAPSA